MCRILLEARNRTLAETHHHTPEMYRSFAAVGTAAATRAAMSHASHASASADRRPQTGPGWAEVFISPRRAASTDGAAKSVAAGHSLLVLSGLASPAECQALRGETSEVAFASRRRSAVVRKALFEESVPGSAVAPGQVRMPISEMLSLGSQRLCDGLLLRSVTRVHRALPTLLPVLFGEAGIGNTPWEGIPPDQDKPARDAPPRTPVASPANNMSIARNPGLVFTPGEPACNVYTEGGCVPPPRAAYLDLHSTVPVPLLAGSSSRTRTAAR